MDSHMSSVVPIAVAVSVMSVFTLASYFAGDWSSTPQTSSSKKRLRYESLSGASANGIHKGESQNYLPSATRNGFTSLQLGTDLSEVGIGLTNSPNRRRQSYNNISSRYPLTARLGHVVEAMDDLRQLQNDTEAALEEQCRQTELERDLRDRTEGSLKAEAHLRGEAESSINFYKEHVTRTRPGMTHIMECVDALTAIINEGGCTPESKDEILQLLFKISQEAEETVS